MVGEPINKKKKMKEMKKRFEEHLNELTRGKEPGKVRIVGVGENPGVECAQATS